MNAYIFLYNGASLFEVDLVGYFMKTKGDVTVITEGNLPVETNEGFKIAGDVILEDVGPAAVDMLVICGGDISNIRDMAQLLDLIRACHHNGKFIGGICAGRDIVAQALGITENNRRTVVMDHVVLSPGNEYVDFALMLGKVADIYEDEEDYQETISYFKRFMDCSR